MSNKIVNTAKEVKENPISGLFVAGSGGIERQEAAGQSQLVNSDVLPAQISFGERKWLEDAGVEFGELVENDSLFQHVILPQGWTKQATDHSMHSDLLDADGNRRAGIFYKAAFYDRRADMNVIDPKEVK